MTCIFTTYEVLLQLAFRFSNCKRMLHSNICYALKPEIFLYSKQVFYAVLQFACFTIVFTLITACNYFITLTSIVFMNIFHNLHVFYLICNLRLNNVFSTAGFTDVSKCTGHMLLNQLEHGIMEKNTFLLIIC